MQGGAAVGGVHDRDEGIGDRARLIRGAGAGLHEALDDEQATVGCDAVGVVGIVLEAVLDRGLARPVGLDLQEAQAGVQVGAGADLVTPTALAGRQEVGVQARGVEVGRGVAEVAQAVDPEDPGPRGEVADDVLGVAGGNQVLAVHAGQETRLGVELGEGDRVDAVGVQHGAVLSGIGSREVGEPVLLGGSGGGGAAAVAAWRVWWMLWARDVLEATRRPDAVALPVRRAGSVSCSGAAPWREGCSPERAAGRRRRVAGGDR